MAEAILSHLVREAGLADQFEIASAGTEDWNIGARPHRGTRAILEAHDIPLIEEKRASQVRSSDMTSYDYILTMEKAHQYDLRPLHPTPPGELRCLMEFAPAGVAVDIPDPYRTGNFQEVYDMILASTHGLLAYIRQQEQL
jgi:protein-tyrosine phosphatase